MKMLLSTTQVKNINNKTTDKKNKKSKMIIINIDMILNSRIRLVGNVKCFVEL